MTILESEPMEIDSNHVEKANDDDNNSDVAPASSAPPPTNDYAANKPAVAVSPVATSADKAVVFSPELLQMYYARLFPFGMLHTWLCYGQHQQRQGNNYFARREFSFTVEPIPGEEIYMRHQSFVDGAALRAAMLKKRPVKMDLGAVYQQPPTDKNAIQKGKNTPVERELIFDVDMDDYDPVRHCGCQGAQICHKCWNFMKMAVAVVDEGLREDFGFEHVAWFYSGRRGVHGWICDEAARALSDEGRSAVANYFSVFLGNENNKDAAKVQSPIHPMLQRAYKVLEPMFVKHMLPATGHGILATPEACRSFLQDLPETAAPVRDKLLPKWTSAKQFAKSTPEAKWNEVQQHMTGFVRALAKKGADKSSKTMTSAERTRLENWPVEVVFRHTYPRLDINVSTHRNHLLKSPFCVHPKTGRVCVPIRNIQEFDPFAVPTLPQLMRELDQYDAADEESNVKRENEGMTDNEENEHNHDENRREVLHWKKTSLKEYFEPFQKEFLDPMIREQRRQERDEAEQKAAILGDF